MVLRFNSKVYLSEFQRLHFLFEGARKAAVEGAGKIQESAGLFKFDIDIQTPIIVFPEGSLMTPDCITMNLGKITASNVFEVKDGIVSSIMTARLSKMKLFSCLREDGGAVVDILKDVSMECTMNRYNLNGEEDGGIDIPNSLVSE